MLRLQNSAKLSRFKLRNGVSTLKSTQLLQSQAGIQVIQNRNFSFEDYAKWTRDISLTLSDTIITDTVISQLQWAHEVSGLPWWAIIASSAVFFRTFITFPAQVFSQKVVANRKIAYLELQNELIPALKRKVDAKARQEFLDAKEAKIVWNKSIRNLQEKQKVKYNVAVSRIFVPQYVQIPFWMSSTFALQKIANMPENYLDFATQGPFFMTDLTIAPPIILPIYVGFMFWSSMQVNRLAMLEKERQQKANFVISAFFNLFIALMAYMCSVLPSGVGVFWATSATMGFANNLVLLSPSVKKVFKIPIVKGDPQQPYKIIYHNILRKFKK